MFYRNVRTCLQTNISKTSGLHTKSYNSIIEFLCQCICSYFREYVIVNVDLGKTGAQKEMAPKDREKIVNKSKFVLDLKVHFKNFCTHQSITHILGNFA